MRGKVFRHTHTQDGFRITPAYAGKSYRHNRCTAEQTDHPRLCGEKKLHSALEAACLGSPPPMRGKVKRSFFYAKMQGITPAYAGKSLKCRMRQLGCQDHPRLCGEKYFLLNRLALLIGSPPPMRGKDNRRRKRRLSHRITPAYAGKRKIAHHFGVTTEDHPRLCGEKFIQRCPCLTQWGSPPPMRGKGRSCKR